MNVPARYRKQTLFHGVGPAGQQALLDSRVLLVGCGALGCVVADAMTRAGVGHIRIVDRDFVELSNLQRQVLFTEDDVEAHLPKVISAAERLRKVNSEINIEPIVADVDFKSIRSLADGMDLILDGTDNFEIRYLINDLSLDVGIPWIFTGCTGSHGQVMPVIPGYSACLRCLMLTPPPPGSTETCDTAGVLCPAIGVVASLQAALALRMLVNMNSAANRGRPKSSLADFGISDADLKLTMVDVWDLTFRRMDVSDLRAKTDCPACRRGERLWLDGSQTSGSTILCGRNAVQVTPAERTQLSLPELAERLEVSGHVTRNSFLVRVILAESDIELTIFPDGRAIVKGTEDPAIARTVYARYVGT